jgi:hypothetical protein
LSSAVAAAASAGKHAKAATTTVEATSGTVRPRSFGPREGTRGEHLMEGIAGLQS